MDPKEATKVKPETVLVKVLSNPEMLERLAERAKEWDPYFPYGASSNALLMWLLLEQARIFIPFGSTTTSVVASLIQPFPLGASSLLHNVNWQGFSPEQVHGKAGDIWVSTDAQGTPRTAGLVAKYNPLGDFILSIDVNCHEDWKPRRVPKAEINVWVGGT